MSTFCEVTRGDFEAFFAGCNERAEAKGSKVRWGMMAWGNYARGRGELVYQAAAGAEAPGTVWVRVYTTCVEGGRAREVGKDAIRVSIVFTDREGRDHGVASETRVFRVTSVEAVMGRLRGRMTEAWKVARSLRRCARCGAPAYADSGRCVVRICREQRRAG